MYTDYRSDGINSLQVLTTHTSWSNRERFSQSFVTHDVETDLNSLLP